MSIFELLAVGSALMLIITGFIHSIAGEIYLLRPMWSCHGLVPVSSEQYLL